MKFANFFFSFFILLDLFSCATGGAKLRLKIREDFLSTSYQKARERLDISEDYQDEKNRPLFFMEQGLIAFEEKNYCKAIADFTEAKRLARERFTISTSGQILSFLANDNSDFYYEAPYERSLLSYYLTLSHYLLYLKKSCHEKALSDSELRTELFAARAEVVDWNAWLKTLKNQNLGESVFKDDLMAKILGALIHESFKTSNDDSIALNLYKDAKDLLFKNYNSYKSFNEKSDLFREEFHKLHTLKDSQVKKNYVEASPMQDDLMSFLDAKILEKSQKKKSKNRAKGNKENKFQERKVSIILEKGLIPLKYAKTIQFAIGADTVPKSQVGALAAVSFNLLATFAYLELGMPKIEGPISTGDRAFDLLTQTSALNGGLLIEFELPKMDMEKVEHAPSLEVLKSDGEIVHDQKMILISPLSEIASEMVEKVAAANYLKTGLRVATKQLVAIGAAYASYEILKNKGESASGKLFAKNLALLQYMITSKAISRSEIADTRHWSLLPHEIFLSSLTLPPGSYGLQIRDEGNVFKLQDFQVHEMDQTKKEDEDLFLRFRLF